MIPAISGAIGPLGSGEWSVGSVGSIGQNGTGATGATGGSFNDALTGAVNSLEQTQVNASTAATQLATGQLTDPTQAITSVENASMAMDLASQIRTKLADAVNEVFQTQV
ncbi:MAG TPA: flagellar hook-basal body complex protein FliE [Solirubrobacteraceae bacterium]